MNTDLSLPFWVVKADGRLLPTVTSGPLEGQIRPTELNLPGIMNASWSELCYVADDHSKEHLTRCILFPDESMLEEQNVTAEADIVYMSVMV